MATTPPFFPGQIPGIPPTGGAVPGIPSPPQAQAEDPNAKAQKILAMLQQAAQRKQVANTAVPSPVPGMQDPNEAQQIGMNTGNPRAWGLQRFAGMLSTNVKNAVAKQKQDQLLKAEGDWSYLQASLNELYNAQQSGDPQAIAAAQAKVDVTTHDPKKLKNMAKALNQDWLNPEKTTVYGEALKKVGAKTAQQEQEQQKKQQASQGLKAVFQKLLGQRQQPQLSDEQRTEMGREIQAKAPTTATGTDLKSLELQEKILHDRAEEALAAKNQEAAENYKKAELEIQRSRLAQEDKNREATTRQHIETLNEKIRHDKATEDIQRRTNMLGGGARGGSGATRTGDDALKGLDGPTASLVKKIANYEINPQSLSTKGGHRERFLGLVAQYDPTYDQSQYNARASVKKDFESGAASKNIRSLNTAIGHLADLKEAADGLRNSPYQLWNQIANKGLTATGDPRVTKFNTAANAVESELAALFKGTGATDQEIKAWREQLSAADSPAQLHTAIDTLLGLMSSRMNALDSQYTVGMGKPRDFKIINEKSKGILMKLGGEGGRMLEGDMTELAPKPQASAPTAKPNGGFKKNADGSYTEE